jgi:carbon storage regulator
MLVLSRKQCQQITVGESITITVVGVQGGKVRLGIDAPRDVRVLRSELRRPPADNEGISTGPCSRLRA